MMQHSTEQLVTCFQDQEMWLGEHVRRVNKEVGRKDKVDFPLD